MVRNIIATVLTIGDGETIRVRHAERAIIMGFRISML
jgi:hypothetical protein